MVDTSSLQQMLTNQTGSLSSLTSGSSSTASSGVANTANTGTQQDIYNPIFTGVQSQLQGQAGGLYNDILSGNTGQFGLNNAAYQTAMTNFNSQQAPQLAAQYGAGSPAINSAQQQLQVALAGQSSQQASSNAINAFNSAAQYGFNPVAKDATQINNGNTIATTSNLDNQNTYSTNNQNSTGTSTNIGGILSGIAGTAATGIAGLFH